MGKLGLVRRIPCKDMIHNLPRACVLACPMPLLVMKRPCNRWTSIMGSYHDRWTWYSRWSQSTKSRVCSRMTPRCTWVALNSMWIPCRTWSNPWTAQLRWSTSFEHASSRSRARRTSSTTCRKLKRIGSKVLPIWICTRVEVTASTSWTSRQWRSTTALRIAISWLKEHWIWLT